MAFKNSEEFEKAWNATTPKARLELLRQCYSLPEGATAMKNSSKAPTLEGALKVLGLRYSSGARLNVPVIMEEAENIWRGWLSKWQGNKLVYVQGKGSDLELGSLAHLT